jgi:hypothetical protein
MLFRRLRMETKKLLIPVRLEFIPKIQMRSQVREWFERNHPGSEIIRVHFMENRCFLQVQKQITEYSSLGRLQFNLVEETTEYDMTPRNRREIAEA